MNSELIISMHESELCHTDISLDIKDIWLKYPIDKLSVMPYSIRPNYLEFFYRTQILPLKFRSLLWTFFNKSHIDTHWLERLNSYWTEILKARPILGVLDFAFLHGVYRRKFYNFSKNFEYENDRHLEAFQQPELLYQLINCSYRESIVSEIYPILLLKRHLKTQGSILEFGAGIAPISRALMDFGLAKRQIFIADLRTYAFHYACYRFRAYKNITPIVLNSENSFSLPNNIKFAAMFCREVFEHLPDPMTTIKMFYDRLVQNGILIFDYIKSDGHGLDTLAGLKSRLDVLRFIKSNFTILEGDLDNIYESTGLIIVRRN